MDHVLYQIFQTFLSTSFKISKKTDNHLVRAYLNRLENRVTFKIKTGYYFEFLMLVTMKLLASAKTVITKEMWLV